MIEYDENGICIYEGEYENIPLLCFPRSGFGILYNSGGKKVYDGQWKHNFPQGKGNIYINGNEIYKNVILGFAEISRKDNIYYDVLRGKRYKGKYFTELPGYRERYQYY